MSIGPHRDGLTRELEFSRHLGAPAHKLRLRTFENLAAELSHELAQPISASAIYLQGSIRRIRDLHIDALQKADLVTALEKALTQTERAGRIVASVRSLAVKREAITSEVEASGIVASAIQLLELEAHRHATYVHVADDCNGLRIRVDPIQIEQVIINLVKNAIEASGGLPTADRQVSVHVQRPSNSEFRFTISDRGEGIAASSADRLFQPFFTTKPGGTGLGLSISRSIIEAHGGEIWARNNEDGGAVFGFSLPINTGFGND